MTILFFLQVHPEGKFVVDLDKNIDIADVTPNARVALRNDSYTLHKILPSKVRFKSHIGNSLIEALLIGLCECLVHMSRLSLSMSVINKKASSLS